MWSILPQIFTEFAFLICQKI